MESKVIVTLVVLVAVAVHVALYSWVKFKIQEGVVLQFLRDAGEGKGLDYRPVGAIAAHTRMSEKRVAAVCRRSEAIHADPDVENHWRADPVSG